MTAQAIIGRVFKAASTTLLARVQNWSATNIKQADISAISYTAYLLNDDYPDDLDAAEAVTGHTAVDLDKTAAIFDTLQNDARWTVDSTGYNFRHALDISAAQLFTEAGRVVRIIVTITPTSGQEIPVRFDCHVI